MAHHNESPSPERIWQIAFGFAPPLILEAAVRTRVFDLLEKEPKTLQQLAAETGASARGLRAVLGALVGLEFLTREGDTYALTPESAAFLISTKPRFQGGLFRHISRQLLPNWLKLTDAVHSGRPAMAVNRQEQGGRFFQEFVEDLFPRSYPAAQVLADHLQVARASEPLSVLDVAAGSAVWSIALAEKSPRVQVTVVDWPEVVPVARRVAERRGLLDRYRFVEGDLLEVDFGGGYRVATLGHILHSEGPRRSRELLRKVFAALAPGGTIVIAEMIADDDRTGPANALIFAVNMLVNTEDGDVFSFEEISDWLREAGFEHPRQLQVPTPSPLILATKPAEGR